MLKYLGVSRSGYHSWLNRTPTDTEKRREYIKTKIQDIYDESKQNYGAPKITRKLRQNGEIISERTVELNKRQIKTPTGKTVWSKRALEHILTNEKYIGTSMVYKTYCGDYLHKRRITNRGELRKCYVPEHHPAIISKEDFEKVQAEIQRRSNIVRLKDGSVKRKTSHYSMKTKETRR